MSEKKDSSLTTLSDIAKMLEKMDKKLDDKVDSVKSELHKTILDQGTTIDASIKRSIDQAVGPLTKRMDEYEIKSDDRVSKLESTVASLSEIVRGGSKASSRNEVQTPQPLLQQTVHPPPVHHSVAPAYTPGPLPSMSSPLPSTGTSTAITDIIAEARTVIGLGPILPSDFEYFNQSDPEVAIRLAALEALRMELNIKESEIEDSDIASTFLPKFSPKIPRVYLKFHKQEHADLCLRVAKSLTNPEIKVFRYFPRQFQARVRALEEVAYQLRKASEPMYKTEVVYTQSDVQLLICPRGQSRYYPHHVPDLPPIDMRPDRSPPPGRQRHLKRQRSENSPPQNNKSTRHMSPNSQGPDSQQMRDNLGNTEQGGESNIGSANVREGGNTGDNDTGEEGSTGSAGLNWCEEGDETENIEEPNNTAVSRKAPSPLPPLPNFQDLGSYSSIQVISPATGKVSFDFQEPVNLRRQSLNI